MANPATASPEQSPLDFQAIFESMPGSFMVLRPDAPHYTILAITNDLRVAMGKIKEDIIGKSIFDLYPEDLNAISTPDPSNLSASLQNALNLQKQDQMPVFRADVPNAAGVLEARYWSGSNKPVLDNAGNVLYIIHTTQEVTNEINAEQQVRAIIESSYHPIGVYLGKDLEIKFANQGLMERLGKGNDIIGKRYKEVLPELENQGIFEILDQVLATGIPFHTENERMELVVDGKVKVYYFNFSLSPLINSAGQVYGIINTGADITELNEARQKIEESEERFRIMADAAPNLVWALHPDSSVRYVNQRFLNFLGITLEKFIADNWVPYIHPTDLEGTARTLIDAIQNRKIFALEKRLLRQDGVYRWLLSHGAPSYYSNGELYGYVGSAIDITELKEAEAALELKNTLLTQTNKDLDNFIYTASHDLRSPITNIEGLVYLLREELTEYYLTTTRTEEILQRIEASVNRFKHTIADLTDISRLQEESSQNSGDESISLPEVYQDIMRDLQIPPELGAYSIQTDFQVPRLGFSRKNFRSVLYNLISNAVKYHSAERASIIQIQTRREGPYVVLCVRDNGLGMSERQQEQLYTMFKRFHDHVEGSGVGLYIVKRIVENAGGKIEVESQLGVGTEFKVYLKADG